MSVRARTVLVLLLMMCTAAAAQGLFTDQQTSDLIHFLDTLRTCRGIVGMSVAVVKGNQTWTRGFGKADLHIGRDVTSSDLFGIGSLTKAFTTALLSVFINDTSRYTWQTPVADILGPDFKFVTEELTRQVTLKDILTHRTGLETTEVPLFALTNWTSSEFARRIRHLPVKNLFRDRYDYNNWLYGLAGYVAEVMGGAPWENLLHKHLLRPLGMRDSGVLGKSVSVRADNLARPYVTFNNSLVMSDPEINLITPLEAAGAMASSADDMVNWMQMIINKGTTQDGAPLVSAKLLKDMTSAQVSRADFRTYRPNFPVTFLTYGYGMSWDTNVYRGYAAFSHSGNLYAYTSFLAFLPQFNLGVFVSNNGPGGKNASHLNRQTFFHIADLLLGEEPWLNTTNACQYPQLWLGESSGEKKPSNTTVYENTRFDHPERYAGCYSHELFGHVDITRSGSRGLYAQYGFVKGQVFSTDQDNVTMVEVVGSMAFSFRPGSDPGYQKLTFGQLVGCSYQEVSIDRVTFRRHDGDRCP